MTSINIENAFSAPKSSFRIYVIQSSHHKPSWSNHNPGFHCKLVDFVCVSSLFLYVLWFIEHTHSFFFYCQLVFHRMNISWFIYTFFWFTHELFKVLFYFEKSWHENFDIILYVDMHFHLSFVYTTILILMGHTIAINLPLQETVRQHCKAIELISTSTTNIQMFWLPCITGNCYFLCFKMRF